MAGQKDIRTSGWQDAHTSHLPCLCCCCLVASHLTTVLASVPGPLVGKPSSALVALPVCCSAATALLHLLLKAIFFLR